MRASAVFLSVGLLCAAVAVNLPADEPSATTPAKTAPLSAEEARAATITALTEFNSLIGGWRGVGQPVRNSNKGAWSETAEWVWDLNKERPGIRYRVEGGKLLRQALLTFDPSRNVYVLETTLPDGAGPGRSYAGRLDGTKLSLETSPDEQGEVRQVVITRLNDKRTLVLFQTRASRQQQFVRDAEVGYTREGTKLAEEGVGGPECIVTGGKGTMSLTYKGQTYWFCCTGCRDAFNDDPEAILAEARQRAAKKRPPAKSP